MLWIFLPIGFFFINGGCVHILHPQPPNCISIRNRSTRQNNEVPANVQVQNKTLSVGDELWRIAISQILHLYSASFVWSSTWCLKSVQLFVSFWFFSEILTSTVLIQELLYRSQSTTKMWMTTISFVQTYPVNNNKSM